MREYRPDLIIETLREYGISISRNLSDPYFLKKPYYFIQDNSAVAAANDMTYGENPHRQRFKRFHAK